MIEISIKLDDDGWHVAGEVTNAGEDEIKGWHHGRVFADFGEAMRTALGDILDNAGGSVIKVTRGAARVALRQITKAGV